MRSTPSYHEEEEIYKERADSPKKDNEVFSARIEEEIKAEDGIMNNLNTEISMLRHALRSVTVELPPENALIAATGKASLDDHMPSSVLITCMRQHQKELRQAVEEIRHLRELLDI